VLDQDEIKFECFSYVISYVNTYKRHIIQESLF